MIETRAAVGERPVAVVLVNWNGWRDTIECVSSVLGQSHSDLHVFVVDNDSSDGSVEHIRAWSENPGVGAEWRKHDGVVQVTSARIALRVVDRPEEALPAPPHGCRLTLIRSGGNLGFAGGCNVGIRAAGLEAFEFFWFLNTDAVAHRDALRALVRRARSDPRIGIVGSTLRYYERPEVVQALAGAAMDLSSLSSRHIGAGLVLAGAAIDPAAVERDLSYVMGASMLVSRRFIQDVGLMQEDYFLFYEEIDWALRGRDRYALAYAADSHVFHKAGASSSKALAFATGLYYRNRVRFAARFFPARLGAIRRGLAIELLRHLLRARWTHARAVASTLVAFAAVAATVRAGNDSPQTALGARHSA